MSRAFEKRESALRRRPMGSGLAAIREALDRLDSPQNAVPVVLIGGTNGKGSTAAMVDSLARGAGYRTGLFHSPALGPIHEHVWLDGAPLDEAPFADRFLRADDAGSLSWFEAITAAAFLTFAEEQVDLAVVEVGLGGRNDCTNVVRDPRVSAITTVALDHRERLGSTLEAVAREKSGIFRRERPALIGWMPSVAEAVLVREAERMGAVPVACSELPFEALPAGESFRFAPSPSAEPLPLTAPLAGRHQTRNAAMAVLIAHHLSRDGFPALDGKISDLGSCRWPGRLEHFEVQGRTVILDAAHNPAAAEALAEYLGTLDTPVDLLFGCFQDKDAAAMLRILHPTADRIFLTATDHPRARPAYELAELVPQGFACDDLALALRSALTPSPLPLCVTGSVDLVGKARRILLG